jgi:hypothetical protein
MISSGKVVEPNTKKSMETYTIEQGMQVYSFNHMMDSKVRQKGRG